MLTILMKSVVVEAPNGKQYLIEVEPLPRPYEANKWNVCVGPVDDLGRAEIYISDFFTRVETMNEALEEGMRVVEAL